jgi:WD40 repeat protein
VKITGIGSGIDMTIHIDKTILGEPNMMWKSTLAQQSFILTIILLFLSLHPVGGTMAQITSEPIITHFALDMSVSQDTRYLAVAAATADIGEFGDLEEHRDYRVEIIDRLTGSLQTMRFPFPFLPRLVDWGLDNQTLYIADSKEVRRYNIQSNVTVFSISLDYISAITLSPDGNYLAVSDGSNLMISSAVSGEIITAIEVAILGQNSVLWMDWNPTGSKIAVAGGESKMHVWNWDTNSLQLAEVSNLPVSDSFRDGFREGSWNEDGTQLAFGSFNSNIRIWNVETGAIMELPSINGIHMHGYVYSLDWNTNTNQIAVSINNSIVIYDAATQTILEIRATNLSYANRIEWISNTEIVISGLLPYDGSYVPALGGLVDIATPNTPPPTPTDPSPTDTPPTSTPPSSSSTPTSSPTSVPSATPTSPASPTPAPPTSTPSGTSLTFQRGINFGGDALTIDGNAWEAGASAPNFSSNGWTQCNPWVALSPPASAEREPMIRCYLQHWAHTRSFVLFSRN